MQTLSNDTVPPLANNALNAAVSSASLSSLAASGSELPGSDEFSGAAVAVVGATAAVLGATIAAAAAGDVGAGVAVGDVAEGVVEEAPAGVSRMRPSR